MEYRRLSGTVIDAGGFIADRRYPENNQSSGRAFSCNAVLPQHPFEKLRTNGVSRWDDNLAYMLSKFVFMVAWYPSLRQYDFVHLRMESLFLNIGQGADYTIETARTDAGVVVAIKHRKLASEEDPNTSRSICRARTIEKALKEIRILKHPPIEGCPNVLSLLGFAWASVKDSTTMPALVVSYAIHGNLRTFLKKNQISEKDKWEFLKGVANGLSALHRSGVIHGDIKLENILVTATSEGAKITQIADFGSSIITNNCGHHRYWGTKIYRAPELRSLGVVPGPLNMLELMKCEAWAFGLLAFEIFLDGQTFINDDIVDNYFRNKGMKQFDQAVLKLLAEVKIEDATIAMKMDKLVKLALRFQSEDRGTFEDIYYLFQNDDAREPPTTLPNIRSAVDFVFLDLTDNLTLMSILRGFGRSSNNPRPLPWSVQVQIASLYQRLSTTSDSSIRGLANINLAICYYVGFGLERKSAEVLKHVTVAANQGSPQACVFLIQLSAHLDVASPIIMHGGISYLFHLRGALESGTRKSCLKQIMVEVESKKPIPSDVAGRSLHSAVLSNDLEALSKLLQEGVPVDQDFQGETALLLACRVGDLQAAKLLLDNDSDPSLCNQYGWTVLHFLFMFEDDDINQFCKLLKAKSSLLPVEDVSNIPWPVPDFWDELYGTPLQWAVGAANITAVAALLELGADPQNASDWLTPIQLASSLFLPEILKLLMKARVANLDTEHVHGLFFINEANPFRTIAIHGKNLQRAIEKTIQVFTTDGGSVDILNPAGSTPLTRIAICNYSRTDYIVALELLKVYDKRFDDLHFTPLQAAILGCNHSPSAGSAKLALRFINDGPSLRTVFKETTCHKGLNVMHVASAGRSKAIVQALHTKDPEILTSRTSDGNEVQPLHFAAAEPNGVEMVRLLLELGAEPLAEDAKGLTPLAYCISEPSMRLHQHKFELLLKASATNSYIVAAKQSLTVASFAALRSSRLGMADLCGDDTLKTILSHPDLKAIINKPDSKGYTALHYACTTPDYTTIKLLVEAGEGCLLTTQGEQKRTPLEIVLKAAKSPRDIGLGIKDIEIVWYKSAYHAACYLAEKMAGSPNSQGMPRLHIAMHCGYVEEVRRLVDADGAIVNAKASSEPTAREVMASCLPKYQSKHPTAAQDNYTVRALEILKYLDAREGALRQD